MKKNLGFPISPRINGIDVEEAGRMVMSEIILSGKDAEEEISEYEEALVHMAALLSRGIFDGDITENNANKYDLNSILIQFIGQKCDPMKSLATYALTVLPMLKSDYIWMRILAKAHQIGDMQPRQQ